MTTLQAIQPFLTRLFAEAEAADRGLGAQVAALPPAERAAIFADHRALYLTHAKDRFLAVSPETGRLLYLLARSTNAKGIVEFGTSFGLSTIHLAAALRDNGGGRLIGSELEPGKAARARAHLVEAGLGDLVDVRDGDALESLARDLPTVDLLLLDGAKPLYGRMLELVLPRLAPRALIVADNADMAPDYVARVRGDGFISVPFGPDVEVSLRA